MCEWKPSTKQAKNLKKNSQQIIIKIVQYLQHTDSDTLWKHITAADHVDPTNKQMKLDKWILGTTKIREFYAVFVHISNEILSIYQYIAVLAYNTLQNTK